jgi:TonB family protein
MAKPEIPFEKLELVYFKIGPSEEVLVKDIKDAPSGESPDKKRIETAKLETGKEEFKEIQKIKTDESKIEEPAEKFKDIVAEPFQDARDETEVLVENDSGTSGILETYHLKVREKIYSVLKKKRLSREGEVYVWFLINKDGVLQDLALYKQSPHNKHLEKAVIESVKEASPFPPFGDEIGKDKLPLKLRICSTRNPEKYLLTE